MQELIVFVYSKQASCQEVASPVQLCGSGPHDMGSAERSHAQASAALRRGKGRTQKHAVDMGMEVQLLSLVQHCLNISD